MPELPEVERGRCIASAACEGQRIARVRCAEDEIVFAETPARVWREALEGARVLAVKRRGKQLWFQLDRSPHPLFHFGMTGAFRVPGVAPLELAAGLKDESFAEGEAAWPPRFWKIELEMQGGERLAMTNARRFGRILLREEPEREAPIAALGFDPLHELPSPSAFAQLWAGRRGNVKGLLLNQRFAAGVGNWIADEVLYQAGVAPQRRAQDLSADEVEALRSCLGHIVRAAVSVDAEKERLPQDWLFHQRWGKQANARTARGEAIEHLTIAGRTTAWVPAVQR